MQKKNTKKFLNCLIKKQKQNKTKYEKHKNEHGIGSFKKEYFQCLAVNTINCGFCFNLEKRGEKVS